MKKDKVWLKGLINEEGIVMDMHLLGRHDEQYWKNENIKINKGRLFYLIDQLDEPEVLSQEWIDENKVARINDVRKMTTSDVVPVEKLKNLIVPKQDKPIIPQFVADWIEKWKREELILRDWSIFNLDDENEYEVAEWLYDNDDDEINILRKFTLIDAIRYGYEVEEEKKYRVQLSKDLYFARFKELKIELIKDDAPGAMEQAKLFSSIEEAIDAIKTIGIGTVEEVTE